MSFSASTCLTYTGTTVLTNPLLLYSDSDNYATSFGSLTLSDITGENCPKIITNIPNGTTKLKIQSNNLYCVFIDISCNDICNICDLNFANFSNNSIGKISVGNLTGSCQSNITDYVVNWYGPDSTTNIAFTSGKGTGFTYGYQHPVVDLLTSGGVYTPKLQKVIVSGITFSSTGGTNQVLAQLDCLPPITVRDFTCSNGTSSGSFTHIMNFSSLSNNSTPGALNGQFLLTGVTRYFGINFVGYTVADNLKITFSGVNYSSPIVLENMTVGTNTGLDVSPTHIPKEINLYSYNKLLCLTGLTMTSADFLTITVTPNTGVTDTSWTLSLKCLETIDTSINGYVNYKNQPYKISANTITIVEGPCNAVRIDAKTIGVPTATSNIETWPYLGRQAYQNSSVNNSYYYDNSSVWIYPSYTACSQQAEYIGDETCVSSGGTIIFNKTYTASTSASTYYMEFSNQIDFKEYYNSALNSLSYSGSSNPTNINYYRYVRFIHYVSAVPSSTTTLCNTDNTSSQYFYLHPASMVITTGTTLSGNYKLSIAQSLLPPALDLNFTSCDLYCQNYLSSIVGAINSSVGVTYSYTTTVGLRAKKPFSYYWKVTSPTSVSSLGTLPLFDGYVQYHTYANKMYPYSGTNTLIPSLSAVSSSAIYNIPGIDVRISQQDLGSYQVRLTNPLNRRDFEIWGRPVVNYGYSGTTYELAYRYSGNTVLYSNPYYII